IVLLVEILPEGTGRICPFQDIEEHPVQFGMSDLLHREEEVANRHRNGLVVRWNEAKESVLMIEMLERVERALYSVVVIVRNARPERAQQANRKRRVIDPTFGRFAHRIITLLFEP